MLREIFLEPSSVSIRVESGVKTSGKENSAQRGQMSTEKNPGCLCYIGDYTTQLCRDYNKPL